jgi:hypothetical protein
VKTLRALLVIAAISVAGGFGWDVLVWRFHFPYPPFHWVVRLIHADGEAAYSAMMYEVMIYIFGLALVGWVLLKRR